MPPRNADPLPDAIPIPHVVAVGDTGVQLNLSAAASPFSSGLAGVNQTANYLFVYVLLAFFLGLLLVTAIYRWLLMFDAQVRHMLTMGREADQRYWMHNHTAFWPKVKKHLLWAPLFRVRHNTEITWKNTSVSFGTLPSRFHALLLFSYVASNIAYCLAIDWSKESYAVVAELRGRTGVLAALNIIPTMIFAMRNNPLLPVLRVSYDTFNLLHRWCARIVVLESILHTIMWAVNNVQAGGLKQLRVSLATSVSYTWGMVGTCAFAIIFLVSVGPLRHSFYEIFLNAHRIGVLLGLIGVYVHLDRAGLPQLPWIQLCFAIWVAEWMWRAFRILYHNLCRRRGFTKVTIEWLPAEACRVTFELSRPWRWQPGCHVHAYIPALAWWSSHPFSVAWAETKSKHPSMEIELEKLPSREATAILNSGRPQRPALTTRDSHFSRKSVTVQAMATVAETTHQPEPSNITLPRDRDVNQISLIVRARNGMTRKLHDKLERMERKTFVTWGAIEGPYGGHESLSSYGTVVLFAGGVGVTHQISYIYHLLLQHRAGTCSTRKILFIWSVPTTENLEWIRAWMDQILRMEGRKDVLRIQLYVTKPRHRGEVVSNSGSIKMFAGRVNPQTILEKELPERIGKMGVTVCGPGPLADSVRSACRVVVTDGSIDFIEEAFTY
ncbi:FRE ferric reductase-like transmembrane component [Lecanosticta acicola]|uniref:FRE ferric reductase-like transmembrane component n=1 Tax=Lecanosticta acicola TaxID=111012 RepID=A0AAI8Z281_9PEZI|nr:FRE ferric reductase-like transmembrane component [Lecanosticta acicola]